MSKYGFKYILRFTIEPGHHEEERLDELITFCEPGKIDDVTFFVNNEELNIGHISLEETRPWMELISRAKKRLQSVGITTSVNPWSTLLHTDRGRKLKEDQKFTLMVDPYGSRACAVVCPLCTEWRKYLKDMYAYYASVKPYMLWVEDDFRLHNHGPLKWGGCFCEKHMEKYSRMAGKKLTREEFVEGILKAGSPHPYRKIWLEVSRDTMVELAAMIGEAVHAVSPLTRVGLMSSSPAVHCAEGRNWRGILGGLSSEITPMVNRPHLPAYSETALQNYLWNFSTVSMLTRSVVPENTELYPEIENFKYSRFSKSKKFTQFQLESSLCMNAHGITLNIFDQMGNGIMIQEEYQDILAESKDFVSSVKALEIGVENQQGIKILFSPESSFTLHTDKGTSMTELYPNESFWGGLLSCYGIANKYSTEKKPIDSIVAISGQFLRNLGNDEINSLFKNNFVMMEAEAVYTLYDMGYGHLAGIKGVKWYKQDSGYYSYEQVCDGKEYYGIKEARISSQTSAGDYLNIEYINTPELKTVVKEPSGNTVGAGMTIYEERVLILPYGRFSMGVQAHLYPIRQAIIQDILRNNRNIKCPVFIKEIPNVPIYSYNKGCQNILMLFNSSGDDIKQVEIYAPEWDINRITEITRAEPIPICADTDWKDGHLILKNGIKNMELKVLLQNNEKLD